ncbi:hypothetical protein A4S06_09015 [Erysipelotrichaceae bacterium MTC7]|nr:hypothetical protein A4S06_09015 [Erysipelotrichaceae bacterium MTC7]
MEVGVNMSGVSTNTKKLYLKKNRILISVELNDFATQKMMQDVSQSIMQNKVVDNIANTFDRHDLDIISFRVDSTQDVTYLIH